MTYMLFRSACEKIEINSMKNTNEQPIELQTAQDLILDFCSDLEVEQVPLAESLGRYPASELVALSALPRYDQSLRDGYAIGTGGLVAAQHSIHSFQIVDEVAAGDTRKLVLGAGSAIRIMTGGLIPANCTAVIPEENCEVTGSTLVVPHFFPEQVKTFIHPRGSELAEGQVIVPKGVSLSPEHLIVLAGVGYHTVQVIRVPKIRFFCTGSELVSGTAAKTAGKKFSANSPLLQGLIKRAGGRITTSQTVEDDQEAVAKVISEMLQAGCDILISTGGMGPGKFDLIEETFCRLGGKVIYSSLLLRPGKSTLFGILGNTLFFGMPGPPPAVHLLFNELIRPAILALQGAKRAIPQKCKARLIEDLFFPKRGLARLKSGVFHLKDANCLVRQAKRTETANCYIYCPAPQRKMRKGEMVTVHLLEPASLCT